MKIVPVLYEECLWSAKILTQAILEDLRTLIILVLYIYNIILSKCSEVQTLPLIYDSRSKKESSSTFVFVKKSHVGCEMV
jgi:hypothetical protein